MPDEKKGIARPVRIFPAERRSASAISFFRRTVVDLQDTALGMLARVIVPEAVSSSQPPHQRKYRIYGNDRSKIGRLLSGLCVRCGLNPGSAVLRGGVDSETCEPVSFEKTWDDSLPLHLVCHTCFDADYGVIEARRLLASPRVPQPLADKPGSRVHCAKAAEEMSRNSFWGRPAEEDYHNLLHDYAGGRERCCTCPVERAGYQARIAACASEEYNRDRDERFRASRFLASLCRYCGKVPAIWVCDECENRLMEESMEESRDAMEDANRTFFEELWRDNPRGYIGRFGGPPDW